MNKKKQLFEKFITNNLDDVYRFAYTYAKRAEYAEDIVSESVIRALRSVDKLRDTSKLKPWFYRIVVNTSLTYLKTNSRFVNTDFAENETMLPPYEDDYSDFTLEDTLKILNDELRCIVVLKICEDMTFEEISEVLRLSVGTVKTRFYRALRILKQELGGNEK